MLLNIEISHNLRNSRLLLQRDVPCVCYIGKDFEIHLQAPLDPAVGTVQDWSRTELAARAPAGGGGRWTHHAHGRVTLRAVADGVYEIRDLAMFYEAYGWLLVVTDGAYAAPKEGLWDEE